MVFQIAVSVSYLPTLLHQSAHAAFLLYFFVVSYVSRYVFFFFLVFVHTFGGTASAKRRKSDVGL